MSASRFTKCRFFFGSSFLPQNVKYNWNPNWSYLGHFLFWWGGGASSEKLVLTTSLTWMSVNILFPTIRSEEHKQKWYVADASALLLWRIYTLTIRNNYKYAKKNFFRNRLNNCPRDSQNFTVESIGSRNAI